MYSVSVWYIVSILYVLAILVIKVIINNSGCYVEVW